MKKCVKCNEVKSFDNFNKAKKNKDGYYSYCRECGRKAARLWKTTNKKHYKKRQREWAKDNTDKINSNANRYYQAKLKFRQYGITKEQYSDILKVQANCCKICGGHDEDRALAIDHCHATGKIRGLLCGRCNKALGLFKDNIESLLKAIQYLSNTDDIIVGTGDRNHVRFS